MRSPAVRKATIDALVRFDKVGATTCARSSPPLLYAPAGGEIDRGKSPWIDPWDAAFSG